jgi:hypothetical protein
MFPKNKNITACFLLALMLTFKLFAVQECVHIQQHKQEHFSYKDTCPICVNIFKIGQNTSFEPADFAKIFTKPNVFYCQEKIIFTDKFLFVNPLPFNRFFNRPPPQFS